MAPRIAPTTEPAFDAALFPEDVVPVFVAVTINPAVALSDVSAAEAPVDRAAEGALADVIVGEAPVDMVAGVALVAVGSEITAEDDAAPKLVSVAPVVLVPTAEPATVTRSSAALAVVIPPTVPQPQSTVAALSHSNL